MKHPILQRIIRCFQSSKQGLFTTIAFFGTSNYRTFFAVRMTVSSIGTVTRVYKDVESDN